MTHLVKAELLGHLGKDSKLGRRHLVDRAVAQRAQARPSRHVRALRCRLLSLREGRGTGQQRDSTVRMCVVGGAACILEIAADSREAETPLLHRLDRPEQAGNAIVQTVVGRHGEKAEAGVGQLIEHPGRRAKMRSPAFQRRVPDEVVGQDLKIGEGDISPPDQVEERTQRPVSESQQPALDDAVPSQGKSKRGTAVPRRLQQLATAVRPVVQSAYRCHGLSAICCSPRKDWTDRVTPRFQMADKTLLM